MIKLDFTHLDFSKAEEINNPDLKWIENVAT